ncbi:MAG: hypothetical protein KF862_05465 [Chitinophagaceae bacterium]|nr:hypothetical protein [Chitinophagaceae bacterium]
MSIFNIPGCSNGHNILETDYKNEKVVVRSIEKKGFSTNSVTYSVKLSSRKKVPLNYETVDIYDRPYSNDIFANTQHYFFSDTPVYKNKIDFELNTPPTMLYLSPAKYSREDFEAYADFFKNKWPDIIAEINKDHTYINKLIIGIAYGKREDFVQYFTGVYNNDSYYFDISADGMILFHRGVPPDNTGFESSGLASKMQMPGKRVLLLDTTVFTPEKLKDFKDKQGKSMADYFTIETATN